jgi:hypothetical protein
MKKEHIPFAVLSALRDNLLSPDDARRVTEHLGACSDCRRENDDLSRLLRLVSALNSLQIKSGDAFPAETLRRVKRRLRISLYKKTIPYAATAALLMVAVGLEIFRGVSVREEAAKLVNPAASGERALYIRGELPRDFDGLSSIYDIKETLSILRKNSARVVVVSDSYIKAEAPARSLANLRREFDAVRFTSHNGGGVPPSGSEVDFPESDSLLYNDSAGPERKGGARLIRVRVDLQ